LNTVSYLSKCGQFGCLSIRGFPSEFRKVTMWEYYAFDCATLFKSSFTTPYLIRKLRANLVKEIVTLTMDKKTAPVV
jgi:hypothetical protein